MDWKKIRRAICGAAAAVAVCFTAAGMNTKPVYAADMGAVYGIFEHGVGWSAYHGDQTAERAGNGTYVTAIRASLSGQPEGMSGTLSYQVNLSGSGWLSWQENMTPNGSTETDMPLEAVRMAFTGQLAENYDVYYSVYQNGSWTTPVKNGETAGTEGQGLRVDGLWVTVTGKGAEVPEGPNGKSVDPTRSMVALTFDDGPSKNTVPILEILDREQVPATFFVCAQDANERYLPLVADIAAAGHQIALHSATHQYSKIYASTDAFWQDIKALRQALEPYVDVGGIDWLRFPGGSTNTVSHRYGGRGIMKTLKAQAEQKGYHWIDWNVCAEDATASHPDAAQILRNIRRDAEGHDLCVVLLHDTKATSQTVKALPDIIQWFREEGYTFCTVAQMQAVKDEVSQPKEQPAE